MSIDGSTPVSITARLDTFARVVLINTFALLRSPQWRVYNAHAPVPIEHKLFRAVRIEDDVDAAVDLLSLLSKQNMGDNRIEELWKGLFVDRQVHTELTDLFAGSDPASELVDLLDSRMPRLTREEIRQSLIRARATFDFPMSAVPPQRHVPPKQAYKPSVEHAAPSHAQAASSIQLPETKRLRRASGRVSPDERKLKLADLIAAGRLRPGTTLIARYLGQQHTAELLADGRVRYQGENYDSPSGAGRAVKIALHGRDITEARIATDGLDFWQAQDAVKGDVVTLKEIRRRVALGEA
ncbi:DUF2924 domain-containing protein [Micromonospora fiedleri]|uniref:DUF2924 domain-containing protein n=1 Tax=Micromonospora fiedleri TaxID=1157498 RepID=A0ABS1UIA9_9ACTN|nr:DUF2924 domain-containing protein [Micromonospora fiedleri]MBL6276080.1 DUF2924 domain-containing protein [Micromonospora fiedleri]